MNPSIMPAGNASRLFDAAVDLQSLGIDQSLAIEEASLASVVRLHSCVIDLYLSPVLAQMMDAARHAFVFSVGLQMASVNVVAPYAWQWLPLANNSGRQSCPSAELIERSMDIAIGACAA